MQAQLQVTEEFAVQVDLPPGSPPVASVTLRFVVDTGEQLREAIDTLGFERQHLNPTQRVQIRFGLPVTVNGEEVGHGDVELYLSEKLAGLQARPRPIPALEEVRAEWEEDERKRAEAEIERTATEPVTDPAPELPPEVSGVQPAPEPEPASDA